MKKLILVITFQLLVIIAYCQDNQDVVYLKNGSVVKGLLMEQIPNEQVKIMTPDGNIFVFKYAEIEKMTKEAEEINLEQYGGHFSYGVAIGGGGIIGVPLRYYVNSKIGLEAGAYFRPQISLVDEEINTNGGLMIAGGPIIYLGQSYNSFKEKIISNGISIKGGYSFTGIKQSMFAVNWARESFKKETKNSFVFELGAGILKYLDDDYYLYTDGSEIQPLIYWKVHWSWYVKQ